ncbi:MAG: methyltransferase domain-containing protein [Clostridiales bacterium]|nr:methyltransferase domain-containing protein [Clostridiales bacterium]
MHKLHFGPGAAWIKPSADWIAVDIDPERSDIVMNFNKKTDLPLPDESVSAIYGSHIFEHIDIFHAPLVFKECHRVLKPDGFLRIVIPDVRKSMIEYLNGNHEYPLFKRRIKALNELLGDMGGEVSLFECLKGDFISPSGQRGLLGEKSLAHQNAWDYEAMVFELIRAGFVQNRILKKAFRESDCPDFSFEGEYPSEADEFERSLYIEAKK